LQAYALALPGFILIKILAPGFFSRQDTKTPVRIGIVAMVCNMAYNLILVGLMVTLAFPAPHTGLALATALSANQQAFMLYRQLRKKEAYSAGQSTLRITWRSLVASAVMAAVIYAITPQAEFWFATDALTRAGRLLVIIISAAGVYLATLLLLRVHPRELMGPG